MNVFPRKKPDPIEFNAAGLPQPKIPGKGKGGSVSPTASLTKSSDVAGKIGITPGSKADLKNQIHSVHIEPASAEERSWIDNLKQFVKDVMDGFSLAWKEFKAFYNTTIEDIKKAANDSEEIQEIRKGAAELKQEIGREAGKAAGEIGKEVVKNVDPKDLAAAGKNANKVYKGAEGLHQKVKDEMKAKEDAQEKIEKKGNKIKDKIKNKQKKLKKTIENLPDTKKNLSKKLGKKVDKFRGDD